MKLFLITTVLLACEFIRPSMFSNYITSNQTLDECINRCEYDDLCQGLIYENDSCLISTKLEITDNSDNFSNQTVYSKVLLKYYSQYCVRYNNRRSCNKDTKCKWNRGYAGYNRENAWGSRGYCGRISC